MLKATFRSISEGIFRSVKEVWNEPDTLIEDAAARINEIMDQRVEAEVNEYLVALGMVEDNGILMIPTARDAYAAVEASLNAFESSLPDDARQQVDAALYVAGMKHALEQIQMIVDGKQPCAVALSASRIVTD